VKVKPITASLVTILLAYLIFAFYYVEAGNLSDSAVSGTYTLQLRDEKSTLTLNPDHSFQQELERAGAVLHAHGEWRLSGEGHIAFSGEFLRVSGQELSTAGQAYGQVRNRFGLLSMTLAPDSGGPSFRKKVFN
jgi:hypothetical protein